MPDNAAGNFIDELSNGDKAILGGSLVVLIALFIPWYSASIAFASDSENGFHRWGLLTFIAWLLVVGLWLLRGPLSSQLKLPQWGVTDGMLFMILGGVEVLGAILVWIDKDGLDTSSLNALGVGYSSGPSVGLFLALVGGLITAGGGYLKQSEPARPVSAGAATPPGGYGAPPPPPPAPPTSSTPPPPAPAPAPPSYGAPPPPAAPPPSTGGEPPAGGAPPPAV